MFKDISNKSIDNFLKSCVVNTKNKNELLETKYDNIYYNNEMTTQEKKFELSKIKLSHKHANDTLLNQQKAFERMKENINTVVQFDVQSKDEIKKLITLLTEWKIIKNEEKKNEIISEIQLIQLKNSQNLNPEQNSIKLGNGFADALLLALITGFVCGIIFVGTLNIFR